MVKLFRSKHHLLPAIQGVCFTFVIKINNNIFNNANIATSYLVGNYCSCDRCRQ